MRLRRRSRDDPSGRRPARRRLRPVLEFFDDLGWAAGRALRRVLRGPAALFGALGAWVTGIPAAFSRFWFGRSLSFRRRTALVLLVLAAYALIRFVSVPGVPCSISTAKDCPPADHAASLVPADAYAYVHVNLDSGSNQFRQAADLADRIPKLAPNFENLVLHGVFFGSLDVAADLQPWLGDEAAFASLPAAGGRPLPLFVLAVRDRSGAERFARLLAQRTPHRTIYRGVTLKTYAGG